VEQMGTKRGLAALHGSISGLAAQDGQADDLGAGTAAAVVTTSAANAVAELAEPSVSYLDYYHGLSRQQRTYWRKKHRHK
jgi:hypothetical protein